MKYYAVKKGIKPGIYTSWDSCEMQVKGYKNAVYKSFYNMDDALNFLNTNESKTLNSRIFAYVDGSYNSFTNEYSFGAVLIIDKEEYQFKKKYEADMYSIYRNVAGEVKGAAFMINYALKQGISELDLYYDYEGIEKWYNNLWKANNDLTKSYVLFAKDMKDKIKINFKKVKGHSNDYYNDLVDSLAKEALGIK